MPRRLLAAALEWSVERLGVVVGGCALLSPRHEPIAWAWGSAQAQWPEDLGVAEQLQAWIFPPGEPSRPAIQVEDDPAQPSALALDRADLGPATRSLERLGIEPPLVIVLRVDGRVAGLIWLGAESRGGDRPPSGTGDDLRVLRLAQPLLELALRDRWYQGGPGAAIGGDLAVRGLTPREEAVARLAIEGLGNGDVAARLGIAGHTVKNHMTRVFAKCGVRSRTQLIALYGADANAA